MRFKLVPTRAAPQRQRRREQPAPRPAAGRSGGGGRSVVGLAVARRLRLLPPLLRLNGQLALILQATRRVCARSQGCRRGRMGTGRGASGSRSCSSCRAPGWPKLPLGGDSAQSATAPRSCHARPPTTTAAAVLDSFGSICMAPAQGSACSHAHPRARSRISCGGGTPGSRPQTACTSAGRPTPRPGCTVASAGRSRRARVSACVPGETKGAAHAIARGWATARGCQPTLTKSIQKW